MLSDHAREWYAGRAFALAKTSYCRHNDLKCSALLSLRLAHLKIGIHGCANCQSLLCLKSAVGIQAVYNELLHCVWASGLFVQQGNQAGSDIFT